MVNEGTERLSGNPTQGHPPHLPEGRRDRLGGVGGILGETRRNVKEPQEWGSDGGLAPRAGAREGVPLEHQAVRLAPKSTGLPTDTVCGPGRR